MWGAGGKAAQVATEIFHQRESSGDSDRVDIKATKTKKGQPLWFDR